MNEVTGCLLINHDSFKSSDQEKLNSAIKTLAELLDSAKFKNDLGYRKVYLHDTFWSTESLPGEAFIGLLDQDVSLLIMTIILDTAFQLEEDENSSSRAVDIVRNRDLFGLLSVPTSNLWSREIVEQVPNIFDITSAKVHSSSNRKYWLRRMLVEGFQYKPIIKVCDETCPVENIFFHDNFLKEFQSMEVNVREAALDRLNWVISGGDLANSLGSNGYHTDANVKDNYQMAKEREVTFSRQPRKIFHHHRITGGYSFYMEQVGSDVYVGKLTSHLTTKTFKKK